MCYDIYSQIYSLRAMHLHGPFFIGEVMAKNFAKSFYKSKAWGACRASYIAKRIMIDGGMCEQCHERPGYIVHHKIPLTPTNINNPDITLNHCNLKYDCKTCHDAEPEHFIKSRLLCQFDADGQPLPPSKGS